MRKLTVLSLMIGIIACGGSFAADVGTRVFVDGQVKQLNPPPIIRNGTTYIALRSVMAALGGCAKWNDKTKTAIVTVGNKRAKIAQSDAMTVNGAMYLPLRKMGDVLGCTTHWDPHLRAVRITTEGPCPVGGG